MKHKTFKILRFILLILILIQIGVWIKNGMSYFWISVIPLTIIGILYIRVEIITRKD
jgi:hypothetical protein